MYYVCFERKFCHAEYAVNNILFISISSDSRRE